jgi:serine/threonine protein kinase
LDRAVALKVLAPGKTADLERKRRFVQEAKAASALNHPNIVSIYDIGAQPECDFIAMEYVAGKTLDQLSSRKGMRLNDVLRISIQIAGGLACAHRAGIVHRDLKPSNVMVDEHGLVKILDFGLAKLTERPASEFAATETLKPQTEATAVVGTAGYMSPEQAEGKTVDARSDIFSFGSLLYEMVTGRRAFYGHTTLSTLAAVINQEPPHLPAETPRDLEKIITRCLRKDPERRFQHMDDVKIALEELKEESESGKLAAPGPPNSRPRRRWLIWTAGAALTAAGGGLGAWWMLNPRNVPVPLTLMRLTSDAGLTTDPAISTDASLIAYASDRGSGNDLDIWVQHRRGGAPIRITHGEGDEREPSFSPDGSQLAYSADGIWVVSSFGGEPRRVAPAGSRPRFSPDGKQILFSSGGRIISSNIWIVDVGAGPPRQLQRQFVWADYPVWSPDGKSILFMGHGDGRPRGWWVTSPADEPARRLGDALGLPEQWAPNGRILYSSSPSPQSLSNDLFIATPSSRKPARKLTGTAGIVGPVSVAADGTMALFASGTVMSNLWTLPLDTISGKVIGEMQPLTQGVAVNWYPSISADGRRLVYCSTIEGNPEIWLMDTATGAKKALTTGPDMKYRPVISADGNRVAYTRMESSSKPAIWTIEIADTSLPGAPRKVCDSGCALVWDWSLDGQALFFMRYRSSILNLNPQRNVSIGLLRFPEGEISDYLADPQRATYQAHLSPDGRWVTVMYAGEVRVAPVRNGKPAGPSEWKIAVKGPADLPRWAPDGNMLFFLSGRDSFRCFWAQKLDSETKTPIGEPFAVQHFHRTRRSLRYIQDSGAIGPALARDRIVFPLVEIAGNVWLTTLKLD